MPTIYVAGSFKTSIDLKDDDTTYEFWTDKKLAKEREGVWPNLTLWLEIENAEEPISPFTIPVSVTEVYDGHMTCIQTGKSFQFEFNGKAKATVHKVTKAAVDEGKKPMASAIAVNGSQKEFEEKQAINLVVQSKKL